jgi:predicted nucleic acid-binding protein
MIVSNATPLIAFARIGELTSLEPIVHRVMLPETVWSEVTAVTAHPGAETIGQATWIAVSAVTSVPAELLALLDRGEAEVIALAEELRAQEVLLDERAARAMAITRGLPVIGTAGLPVRAEDRGFIFPPAHPALGHRCQALGQGLQRLGDLPHLGECLGKQGYAIRSVPCRLRHLAGGQAPKALRTLLFLTIRG